jgi:magnesium-transporting ATPase (P-type)
VTAGTRTEQEVPEAAMRVVHALPGRLRVHLATWSGRGQRLLEKQLRSLPGVRRVEANPVTGNVLVGFDPTATDPKAIFRMLGKAERATSMAAPEPPPPPALAEKPQGGLRRARIAVCGLDRDPRLARRVVARLENIPGVRAQANSLTGRVLVEYHAHQTTLAELQAEIAEAEHPELPGEKRPDHPLDPAPLIQSSTRTVGAAVGLAVLAVRRVTGTTGPPQGIKAAATAAAIISILRSFPSVRNGLRRLFGPNTTDVTLGMANLVAQTFANSPLGLLMLGAEAVTLLSQVVARRAAWRRYEERLTHSSTTLPGELVRLEAGERIPYAGQVHEGTGTAIGRDGLPLHLAAGDHVPAGARLFGGPFVLRLHGHRAFTPRPRTEPLAPSLYTSYLRVVGPLSFGYALLTGVRTLSLSQAFKALLLVNPRPAIVGQEAANLGAAARVLRGGVTVVGSRPERALRLPDVLLLDGPRVLTDGYELASIHPLSESEETAPLLALAGAIATAAGAPWGNAFARSEVVADAGAFDGWQASATIEGSHYTLGPIQKQWADPSSLPTVQGCVLTLYNRDQERPLAYLTLRPRLAQGAGALVKACQRHGVKVGVLLGGDRAAAQAVARRAGVTLLPTDDALQVVRRGQEKGLLVALVSDSATAGEAFAACDLAIGLTSGRSGPFPARADVLAPDLLGVAAIIDAGARRQGAVRDAVLFSVLGNLAGAYWGWTARPGVERASLPTHLTSLAALMAGWIRLAGGRRPGSSLAYLADPRPERWGRLEAAAVLRALKATPVGLSSAEASWRRQRAPGVQRRHEVLMSMFDQVRQPTTLIVGGAACFSLFLGHVLDFVVIGATIGINIGVGIWQERQAGRAAEALRRLGAGTARVLRDGRPATVSTLELVPGDVLLLERGDWVAADARLLEAHGLELDEAALTGESLPVPKTAASVLPGSPETHIVLEGSNVHAGSGRAMIVAVGRHTRMGALAAALALDEVQQSPLGARLGRLLWESLPLTAVASAVVVGSGWLRGQALLTQLAVGGSLALAAVPEGLPMLSGVGQAAAARRLAARRALVRRPSAVEALGRVDVACADKTGTMTEGRLALSLIANREGESTLPGPPAHPTLLHVLRTGALASPHPDSADLAAHPTDVAVVAAACAAGMRQDLEQQRQAEAPFDPRRSFHAALVAGRLCVKGAPEAILPRCDLDDTGQQELFEQARRLAARGLRVLMVAQGSSEAPPADPHHLVPLGFLGISDPLRPAVRAAVRRCREAGVRVVMITGDHPATARSIAAAAGLLDDADDGILTGAELATLHNGELDRQLAQARVIARATPLDKLRIIESLQRCGHTVAMTGDGVNDAPALRLADVGVAMGRGGTEVARQAADLVLADDDFSTLVEALVEGRSFWRNIRRSLGLLLGGNLGELGLIAGTSLLGLSSPLNPRQILMVNLITDALPALSVVLRKPEHHQLAGLSHEGVAALDRSLRTDVLRRGTATASPALAAYFLARILGNRDQANAAAFGTIVATQLTQTLDAGWAEGQLDSSVLAAVGSSAGVLVAALTLPPVRALLGLPLPGPLAWSLIGGGGLAAVLFSRLLAVAGEPRLARGPI